MSFFTIQSLARRDPRVNRNWSRREDLNTPSADYSSAALTLSYTGVEELPTGEFLSI
jgi:hypothetical protein